MSIRLLKKLFHKPNPAESFDSLRERVDRFFKKPSLSSSSRDQLALNFPNPSNFYGETEEPTRDATNFLDFISSLIPAGNLYLFGGILRDIALFGKRGFNSDIDLVVDGDWAICIPYIEKLGARLNKFGGYRLVISEQPIDIWSARETWAIKQQIIPYNSIASLTETTVLNWDAILMNWRTKNFIYRNNYLEELKERTLNIVLEDNPNPRGMAVRAFRHLCLKDAKKITPKAVDYLERCTKQYSFEELKNSELIGFGNTVIEYAVYRVFERLSQYQGLTASEKLSAASEFVKREGITLSSMQTECNFDHSINY